jgi:hypothetical protein
MRTSLNSKPKESICEFAQTCNVSNTYLQIIVI